MAGYSGTPLGKKLGLKDGAVGYLVNVPEELRPVFAGLDVRARLPASCGYIHLFETDASRFVAAMPRLARALADDGLLWVSWPKKASKRPTTVDEHMVRSVGLDTGLVDVKVCAVDEVWSGLKFVRRLRDRKKRSG
jgi:hypothetical protein